MIMAAFSCYENITWIVPFPLLISSGAPLVRSTTVLAELSPYPASSTSSICCAYFSAMSSGSVVYSITSSGSCTELTTNGPSSCSAKARGILWSGIRIPMDFLFASKSLGTDRLAGRMKVKGPGRHRLSVLNTEEGMGRVNWESLLSSSKTMENSASFGFNPLIRARRLMALTLRRSQAKE